MNSIFSSFDAFSAELLGQKVRVSFAPTTTCSSTNATQKNNNNNLQSQESTKDVAINKKTSTSSSSKPRFAPELDGLNCFETLVYY
ncbi:hypothetical protein EZV62_023293 [Acer yangbiense]|uniref:Uncharacterized protein n=1 Tax=Acer yangbiense TaxID=1000413 RepID=A0A5C7H1W0_9ROSI|nr:hypothetical protein EZV62_023293 [Acer yangbiense]